MMLSRRAARYRLVRPLRLSRVGVVWEASDGESRDQRVELQIFTDPRSLDDAAWEAFRENMQPVLWPLFSNPGVATIFGCEEDGDLRFLVAERVAGESLAQLVRQIGALGAAEATAFAADMADTLGTLHDAGVIHGDLRPENIVITTSEQPRMLEAGIAGSWRRALSSTRHGLGVWERRWGSASPRWWDRERRRDVYALGAVFHLMLTGRPVTWDLRGDASAEPASSVRAQLRKVHPPLPKDVAHICEELLVAPRTLRASELASRLRRGPHESSLKVDGLDRPSKSAHIRQRKAPADPIGARRAFPGTAILPRPRLSLPKLSLPKLSLPKLSLPKLSLPKLSLPARFVVVVLIVVAGLTLFATLFRVALSPRGREPSPPHKVVTSTVTGRPAETTPTVVVVLIPSVRGLTVIKARDILVKHGLELGRVVPTRGTPGVVVRTAPPIGTLTPLGTEITAYVGVVRGRLQSS
jgi:serine/threonine protein kinase